MSKLRPTLSSGKASDPVVSGATAYLVVYNAVKAQDGLCHGVLDNAAGEHCAIGSYFALPQHVALYESFIDEVAAVNDSAPSMTPRQRKLMMLKWLRWKLQQAGMKIRGKAV